jgi:hypothetical protein
VPLAHALIHRTIGGAGQRDQALLVLLQPGHENVRPLDAVAFEIGTADQCHQPLISPGRGGIQYDGRQSLELFTMRAALACRTVFHVEVQLAADQRLNSSFHCLDRKLKRPEQIVGVGDRKSWLLVGKRALDQGLDRQRAFEKRVGGMHTQMHKAGPSAVRRRIPGFARAGFPAGKGRSP